jgi:predicted nicotinamide N-methyase
MQVRCVQMPVFISGQTITMAVPDADDLKKSYNKGDTDSAAFPFWAKIWPASKALSQFIIGHPQFIANKKVMEIAAGLGLPSLVAAPFAKEIMCTDAVPQALDFVNTSIRLNGCTNIKTDVLNWNNYTLNYDADVLLMSDVNYNPGDFPQLLAFFQTQFAKKVVILLSTPQRLMAKPFIEALAENIKQHEEFVISEKDEKVVCTVFVLGEAA